MKIVLPSTDLITPSELALLIANALQPSRRLWRDMACIAGKRLAVMAPDSDQPEQSTPIEFTLCLSAAENDLVRSQLDKLPPLNGAMNEAQRHHFLREFKRLNPELKWTLRLESGEDSELEVKEREKIRDRHLAAIRTEISTGGLHAVNADYTPAKHLGALLPMAQAEIYLMRCGISRMEASTRPFTPAETVATKYSANVGPDVDTLTIESIDDVLLAAIRHCQGSFNIADVWPKLVEMAMGGQMGLRYEEGDHESFQRGRDLQHQTLTFLYSIEPIKRGNVAKKLTRWRAAKANSVIAP